MNKDVICAEIIDDEDNENDEPKPIKPKTKRSPQPVLKKCYDESADPSVYEIGVDEVGRGPLFGRVYTAAVVLPKDDSFDCSMVKDSKKFHSKKKIEEASNYIKDHALAWYISFEDEKTIDEVNILQATQLSMHHSIREVKSQLDKMNSGSGSGSSSHSYSLLIDGNYFKPFTYYDKKTNKLQIMPYITVEGGDNTYASIAAASILAKVERDKYIDELCEQNPTLAEYYNIDSNKGYGAKKHLDGIKAHGITIWHRRSFGICKQYADI